MLISLSFYKNKKARNLFYLICSFLALDTVVLIVDTNVSMEHAATVFSVEVTM
jgi:hypothetical protein